MDAKFFGSLFEGDSPNGVKLGMGLTGGDFWPRVAGCHTVYRGQDGNFDCDTIQAVMSLGDTQIAVNNQDLPADTIWYFIRRQASGCGLESPDSPVCIIPAGPNAPQDLSVEQVAGGKLRLKWRYSNDYEQMVPTGFYVYIDSGSGFDFENPAAIIPAGSSGYYDGGYYQWTSEQLEHDKSYKFTVRSYSGDDISKNSDIVFATADSHGPDAIIGLMAEVTDG